MKRMNAIALTLPLFAGLGIWVSKAALGADVQVLQAPGDVCSLVSTQTVTAIFGSPASSQTSNPASQCLWTSASSGERGINAILMLIEWPGPTEVTRLAQAPNFGVAARSGRRVTELPAAAMWLEPETPEYADHELLVLSGGMVMSIYVSASPQKDADAGSQEYAAAVKLAKEALLNLP